MSASWAVVTTVKAPDQVIDKFIEHYLSLGANNIYIFLDNPDFQSVQNTVFDYKVQFFECTEAFWKNRPHHHSFRHAPGEKPSLVEYRQYHNIIHAVEITDSDWLLNVDIDEHLLVSGNVSDSLSRVPTNVYTALLKPYEAVYYPEPPRNICDVFDTKYFKSRDKVDYKFWGDIYKNDNFHQKSGYFGHVTGKSFIKTSEDMLRASCHLPLPMNDTLVLGFIMDDMRVLHYEAMTPELFVNKIVSRSNKVYNTGFLDENSIKRINYLVDEYKKHGVDFLFDAYKSMHVFDKKKISECTRRGFIIDKETVCLDFKSLRSYNGKEIVYHSGVDEICVVDYDTHNPSLLFKVNVALTHGDKKACLFIVRDGKTQYILCDRNGILRLCKTKSAQFFDVSKDKSDLFTFFYEMKHEEKSEGKYLSSGSDGLVRFVANEAKAWEVFSIF